MRINKFVALASGLSRRAADKAIEHGEITVNGQSAQIGQEISESDDVMYQGRKLQATSHQLIMLNKPVGYVVSRDGQGSKTIYDLLPPDLHNLKPIGRLDKDSSGLLLLTNDGNLANELTHPKYSKEKIYEVTLDKPLTPADKSKIEQGIKVDNYVSRLHISKNENGELKTEDSSWQVTISMGRNRQIRRTFEALGYKVTKLHRIQFGNYKLPEELSPGEALDASAPKVL